MYGVWNGFRSFRRCLGLSGLWYKRKLSYLILGFLIVLLLLFLSQADLASLPKDDSWGQRSQNLSLHFLTMTRPEQKIADSFPTLVLGRDNQKGKNLIIGVPTTRRTGTSYVLDTLQSLTLNSEVKDRAGVLIVVQISGAKEFVADLSRKIYRQFMSYISEGFLQVVQWSSKEELMPSQPRANFGDSFERIRWRAKQNGDVASLLHYCSGKSNYYLHLEDDVVTVPGYIPKLYQYIKEAGTSWRMLEFSPLGAIAKLFHGTDLPILSGLLALYYGEQPTDFLMYHHLKLSVQTKRYLRIPSLFKHVGHVSTLANQTRQLVDPFFFLLEPKSRSRENPPARLKTSMKTFYECSIENSYYNKSFGFFWGQATNENESIVIIFQKPQIIDRVRIESGVRQSRQSGDDSPDLKDTIVDAVLEISTDPTNESTTDCKNYEVIAKFKNGCMEVTRVSMGVNGVERITCLRVSIFDIEKRWIFIRDIDIKVA